MTKKVGGHCSNLSHVPTHPPTFFINQLSISTFCSGLGPFNWLFDDYQFDGKA